MGWWEKLGRTGIEDSQHPERNHCIPKDLQGIKARFMSKAGLEHSAEGARLGLSQESTNLR